MNSNENCFRLRRAHVTIAAGGSCKWRRTRGLSKQWLLEPSDVDCCRCPVAPFVRRIRLRSGSKACQHSLDCDSATHRLASTDGFSSRTGRFPWESTRDDDEDDDEDEFDQDSDRPFNTVTATSRSIQVKAWLPQFDSRLGEHMAGSLRRPAKWLATFIEIY